MCVLITGVYSVRTASDEVMGVVEQKGWCAVVKMQDIWLSFPNMLCRTNMSAAQREQLTALLDDVYEMFVDGIAASRAKTAEEVWHSSSGVNAGSLSKKEVQPFYPFVNGLCI